MALSAHKSLDKILQFIKENEQVDPAHLVLKAKHFPDMPIQEIAEQIAARQKAKHKLPEWYNNRKILFPPSISMEQCSSEATAKFKASLVSGIKLVDLSGGFGIDTYHLSQNFVETIYVEQQAHLCDLAAYNFRQLAKDIIIKHGDASSFLADSTSTFTWLYVDPARRDQNQKKVSRWQDCSPDLISLLPQILSKTTNVLVKGAPMLDISQGTADLDGYVKSVYVVEWRGEVRELLFHLTKETHTNPEITAVLLNDIGKVEKQFSASKMKEDASTTSFSLPQKYLFEPSPAVMKSGLFKSLAQSFGLQKLHPNTQLFTSADIVINFPGRSFEVLESLAVSKKALKKVLPDMKANLSNRNFPMPVADLKKKLGLQDGGDKYIFACTLADDSKQLLLCKKGLEKKE
jgi:hypothetical protein